MGRVPGTSSRIGCCLGLATTVATLCLLAVAGTAQAAPRGQARVTIAGPEQVVFDWSSQACEPAHIPDLPARAFRDYLGQVHLLLSHWSNRQMVGSSLDDLQVRCATTLTSTQATDPSLFDGWEWVSSVYTEDGQRVSALVHNEFQGHRVPGLCPSGDYQRCWYNSIGLAVSTDAGASFGQAPAPSHLVAALPSQYQPDAGPAGYFEPSSIVKRAGYYYAIARVIGYENSPRGSCLMRTPDLSQPKAWRGWDGHGFSTVFGDPYRAPGAACRPVSKNLLEMTGSLTYNTTLGKYLLIDVSGRWDPGKRRTVWGLYFSTSSDLVRWDDRQLIAEMEIPWTYSCGDADPVLYASVLDPTSTSKNFETSGATPFLYYTRFHYSGCRQTSDRDLVRVPLSISAR